MTAPPKKQGEHLYPEQFFAHKGPEYAHEDRFGSVFVPTKDCLGLCNDPVERTLVLNIAMDSSNEHNGVEVGFDYDA
jgi:hypothetical protein